MTRTVIPDRGSPVDWPWRVGTQVGRTIYACPPGSSYRDGEVLIGMMDTPELAAAVVIAHNERLPRRMGGTDFLHGGGTKPSTEL